MQSFHGRHDLKEKIMAGVRWHAEQDHLQRGLYWDEDTQKGCAVGCTLKTVQEHLDPNLFSFGNHELYERFLGIQTGIADIEERVFELSSHDYAMSWPTRFLEAIPVGADLSRVIAMVFLRILTDSPFSDALKASPCYKDVLRAVRAVTCDGDHSVAQEVEPAMIRNSGNTEACDACHLILKAVHSQQANLYATRRVMDALLWSYNQQDSVAWIGDTLLNELKGAPRVVVQ